MGLFSFLRDVGAKLSGSSGAYAAPTPETLAGELRRLGLPADAVHIEIEGDTAHLTGTVPDAETRERVVLAVGNVNGIGQVDDKLTGGDSTGRDLLDTMAGLARVPAGAATVQSTATAVHGAAARPIEQGPGGSAFYTVQKGDTLSAIAQRHYGDANAYPTIFEANRPMLVSPDRIYPGQVLRLPVR